MHQNPEVRTGLYGCLERRIIMIEMMAARIRRYMLVIDAYCFSIPEEQAR